MEALNSVAKFFVQTPLNANITYAEFQAMSFAGRVKAQNWSLELVTSVMVASFVGAYILGNWYNTKKANNFFNGLKGVLNENFAQVGVSPDPKAPQLEKDTPEQFTGYATGRENIASVAFQFTLQARQNFLVWFFEFVLSFFFPSIPKPEDTCEITIYPSQQYDNFIAGIVNKNGMNDHRQKNFYLSLTTTNDSSLLPVEFVYMTEVNELAERITTDKIKNNLFKSLRYVAFTDLPVSKPEEIADLIPRRRIVVSVDITSDKAQLAQLSELLEGLFEVVDGLAANEIKIRPETLKKIVKTRDNEVNKIRKLLDEDRELRKQEEAAQKLREEAEARRRLSPQEQLKLEKKEQEKKRKKMLKKQQQRVRM
ncbi:hypothetical protein DIURU_004904 [Diutina rugosa]|uniref:Uncharacterized protein n=1 Tax=Diutina rugosa TaxID=5481 RepID=A0A642UFL4_DIURU|nr:uncharacterized protein DIURU_004904 [Diutina rugosa]KAA8898050.1 hypothetical protein DIURU_004904 [Diutina rugosa]